MQRFLFSDGDKIGLFDGENSRLFESEYIKRYREYAQARVKNDEWKHTGEGARFRGDIHLTRQGERVDAYVNGVEWADGQAVYCFTVNSSSGIYQKDLADEKARESHLLSSSNEEYLSLSKGGEGVCAVTVRTDGVRSNIGLFYSKNSELKTLTDGDSRDENPTFSPVEKNTLYFDTAGVGRDANGEFSGKYSPSSIVKLSLDSMEISEVLANPKLSYFKPKFSSDGTMYCIQRPNQEKKKGNVFLEILLVPVRIVQAIVLFVSTFVTNYTGKSMTSGGANPAKGRETQSKKLFVDGNLIQVDEEYKRNQKFKDREYGFIPHGWKLVRVKEGEVEVLEHGVCDFALCDDGGLYFTDGRHVFYGKDGKREKIVDTALCLSVATEKKDIQISDVFGF